MNTVSKTPKDAFSQDRNSNELLTEFFIFAVFVASILIPYFLLGILFMGAAFSGSSEGVSFVLKLMLLFFILWLVFIYFFHAAVLVYMTDFKFKSLFNFKAIIEVAIINAKKYFIFHLGISAWYILTYIGCFLLATTVVGILFLPACFPYIHTRAADSQANFIREIFKINTNN